MESKPLADRWWEHCSGVVRFYPKLHGHTLRDIIGALDRAQEWGFDAIEVFAPYHGGTEYAGLDVKDYYQIDPAIGTMDDFLELVGRCHERGLAIIAFLNLGYGAMDFPVFLKACDDVRAGADSPETRWFLWSDTGAEALDRSLAPHFMNDADGHWCYSERAGKYYWVKWRGTGGNVELPQFNFGDPVLQGEIKRAVEFWMETGIDGMIIDAVNWYINCNWQINNETMTDVIRRYPNQYIQPEGGGGFDDDPVLWIEKGHYTSVQDYGLSIWWTKRDVVGQAILSGDPSGIEPTLNGYRDRVVAAGGVTYIGPRGLADLKKGGCLNQDQMLLESACIATVGELFHVGEAILDLDWPPERIAALKQILRTLQAAPALQAAGSRRRLPTNDDQKYYAFLRTSKHAKQQVLVVLNFQADPQRVAITMDRPTRLRTILSVGEMAQGEGAPEARITLPGYGYGIYLAGGAGNPGEIAR
jgi:hypothetical protein